MKAEMVPELIDTRLQRRQRQGFPSPRSDMNALPAEASRHTRASSRIASVIALLTYSFFFFTVYRNYLSLEWAYTGLVYAPLSGMEIFAITSGIALQAWAMPQKISSPSSVIIWMLTCLIYVPTMIITLMIGDRPSSNYYPSLVAFTVAMVMISAASGRCYTSNATPIPPKIFFNAFLIVFGLITILLFIQYGSIMSLASVEDVYFQRFAAADIESLSIVGYLRTHYLYVFASLLFAAGLLNRSYWYMMPLGLFGYFVTYLIDASKIAFIIPILMLAFVTICRFAQGRAWVLSFGLAGVTLVSGFLPQISPIAKIIADLILCRAIAIPAQTFAQYSDVFAARGYTFWSNVRGISAVVPPPASFVADPFWPTLGQIVGSTYYGMDSRVNLNANLFAGEGVAAAGWIGILVIGAAFAYYLRLLDRAVKGWNQTFVVLVSVPMGMSLANTHLTTFLLSFGGLFWLAVFHNYKPKLTQGEQ